MMEKGFSGVTLNDVIARSGGSRTTLYDAFGGKEGLLEAVMTERCTEVSEELRISLESDLPPREALTDFALKLSNKILSEEAIRFTQILVSEGHHFAPLVEKFLEIGPKSTRKRIAEYLKRQHDLGNLVVDDPDLCAELFDSMIAGDGYNHVMRLSARPAFNAEENKRRIQSAVDIFLCGVTAPDKRHVSGCKPRS